MSTLADAELRILGEQAVQTVERRQDARHKATYRPCCVIASKNISMGLIRNFSTGGARVEADSDLEIGDRVSYFWEASTCISAKVVWRDGKTYGFEHTDSLRKPQKEFPIRSVRVPCKAEATCWINGEVHTVLVENISLGGMRVRGLPDCERGTLLSIVFCDIELNSVSVRWFENRHAGLNFSSRMTREMLAQLLIDERFGLTSIDFSTGR